MKYSAQTVQPWS